MLFAHHLSRRKGAHMLPTIVKQLAEEDILFIIVGSGPEEENLKKKLQTTSYKLQGSVRFEGSVPNTNMPPYFAAADVFLMPSEEEGFPNVLLEAMAAGVPFVVSDVGGVREIVPPAFAVYVLPPHAPEQFANAIKKLFADKESWRHIGETEKEWVRQYDISRVLPQFLEVVEK